MTKTKEELLESIDQRLKMLLQLRIEEKLDNFDTNKEKVKLLHQAGFSTQEIANFVGSTSGSVRGTKSALRDEGEIDD